MYRFSHLQLQQLKALNNQIEARLTRSKSVALGNEWRQKQHMRNYQSEYDRIRNELSTSAIPFQTPEGLKNRTIEVQTLGLNYIIVYHNLISIDIYIYIYIYMMNNSVKGYHIKPTYDELIQEAVIKPRETIKYPTIIATL